MSECNMAECKAVCCSQYPMLSPLNEMLIEWLDIRGIKYVLSKTHVLFWLACPCNHLTIDYKCDLHGTPGKPLVCSSHEYLMQVKKTAKMAGFDFDKFIGGTCSYAK